MGFVSKTNPYSAGTYSPYGSRDPLDLMQTNNNSKFQHPQLPTPPNYQSLIDEQAKMNRINQNTPFGSLAFSTDKNGNITANYNLSPQYQKMTNAIMGQLRGGLNGGIQYDKGLTQKYYNDEMSLMQPQMQQQQDAFTQNLADRGLPAGSQLAGSLTDQFNQGQNSLLTQAAQDAISKGMGYGQLNQTRQQGLLGMLGAFSPGLNSFFSPSGVDVNGSASLAANAANQNYNAMMQAYSGNQQGLFGLGAAGIGALFSGGGSAAAASDRRLKADITRIGETKDGLPLYTFRYKGDPVFHIGPMSDEVRQKQPEAVFVGPDGYDRVYYGMLH